MFAPNTGKKRRLQTSNLSLIQQYINSLVIVLFY